MRRIGLILVLVLLLASFSSSGRIKDEVVGIRSIAEPFEIGIAYINLTERLIDIMGSTPIISIPNAMTGGGITRPLKDAVLMYTGIYDVNPGTNNLEYYAGINLKKTEFGKMVESWDNMRKIHSFDRDPKKSLELARSGIQKAIDAFVKEEQYLVDDGRKADEMGLDNFNYSSYAGFVSEENWKNLVEAANDLQEIAKEYSRGDIDSINESISELKELNVTDGSILNGLVKKRASRIRIGDYYNDLFGGDSIYTLILRIRGKLNLAMQSMENDWELKKKRYETWNITRPKLELSSYDVGTLFDIKERPEEWINKGDGYLYESEIEYKKAIYTKEEKKDDYLYNAIQHMEMALVLKQDCQMAYGMAVQIENSWKEKIDRICSKELSFKSILALKYYKEGKELCSKSDYKSKLLGAKRIEYAEKIEISGADGILQDLKKKLNELKDLIDRAKIDEIYVNVEEESLEEIEKDISLLEESNEAQVIEGAETLVDRISEIENEIYSKAYSKYRMLEDLRKEILIAKDFLPNGKWQEYEYMFSGYKLNVRVGIGNLKNAKEAYLEALGNLENEAKLNKDTILVSDSVFCNKNQLLEFKLVLENPFPVKVRRVIEINGNSIPVSLNPLSKQTVYYKKLDEPAKCEIIDKFELDGDTWYKIQIDPKYEIKRLYLPVNGDPVIQSVEKDEQGLFVKDVYGKMVVTVVLKGNKTDNPENSGNKNNQGNSSSSGNYSEPGDVTVQPGSGSSNDGNEPDGSTSITPNLGASDPGITIGPQVPMYTPPNDQPDKGWNKTTDDSNKRGKDGEKLNEKEEEEYTQLLEILKKNKNCTYLDTDYLENERTKKNLELMRKAVNNLRNNALSKINDYYVLGMDDKVKEAENHLENDEYCKVLSMPSANPRLETGKITGFTGLGSNSIMLPVAAILVIAYFALKKRKPPENKIIKILKSTE